MLTIDTLQMQSGQVLFSTVPFRYAILIPYFTPSAAVIVTPLFSVEVL